MTMHMATGHEEENTEPEKRPGTIFISRRKFFPTNFHPHFNCLRIFGKASSAIWKKIRRIE